MLTMSATDFARNLSRTLDRIEYESEEVQIIRNNHLIAKIIPGSPKMTAMEAFSNLFGLISDEEGKKWLDDCDNFDRSLISELENPWER